MTAELNQTAPSFTLPDLQKRKHNLGEWRGRVVVLEFWSAECESCERADMGLSKMQNELGDQMTWVVIAAAQESSGLVQRISSRRGIPLLLLDNRQTVTAMYGVTITPTMFVLDEAGVIRYHGAYDDRTFRKRTPERIYVMEAVKALLAGRQPALQETPIYGCMLMRLKS